MAYVSNINKNQKELNKLLKEPIKSLKFNYQEGKSNIEYNEFDINGPKIGIQNIEIDFNWPKIGGGLDIHGPKIGIPNLDVDIKGPKIGGDLDIHGPKIELSNEDKKEPLTIRQILTGGVNDPIILNKKVLKIPNITVKGKRKNYNLDRYNTYNILNRPSIGLPNVVLDINAPNICGYLDIHRPKIGAPSLDINSPRISVGLDIHGPKIGLPNGDVNVKAPKLGGGLDIYEAKY